MITLTANETLPIRLIEVKEKAEIRDCNGDLLGYFTPRAQAEAEIYERAKTLFDPAETAHIATTERGQGRPLQDFLKELEARGNPG